MNEQCLTIVFFVLRVGKNGTISYLCRSSYLFRIK